MKVRRIHAPLRTAARAWRFIRNAVRPAVEVYPAPADLVAEWDVPVTLRDGTVLRLNVFRPAGVGPFPVILSAHPYGKDRIPAHTKSGRSPAFQSRVLPQPQTVRLSALTSWEAPDPAVWVAEGYAVVNADLRGGGSSEGVGDLFSDEEAEDYAEVIAWAGGQPWSTGRVGLDGVSYLAISQYKVAALQPPHLAAICPWEGLTDLYRDFGRPGGVREDGFSILWSRITGKEARVRTSTREGLLAHPLWDDWYEARTPDLARIKVPILVCASFSDHSLHTRGSFEVFRRAGSRHKRVYTHRSGKWCAYYGDDATQARLRFFDWALKGVNNGWPDEPPVRLEVVDEGAAPVSVTHETAWPPEDLFWRTLHLDAAAGTVGETAPDADAVARLDSPNGLLAFVWTASEDMDLIGPMVLTLSVAVEGGDDATLFVGCRKMRAGREVLFEGSYGFSGDMMSKGWQRLSHRELDPTLSTPIFPVHAHRRAEPLAPGEVVDVKIALRPHATRFRKGDQLRLELAGRWHYPQDPLRGQFPGNYQKGPEVTCFVHTGPGRGSSLLVGTRPPKSG